MTAFEKAWIIAKAPLSDEALEMFDKDICPQCKGAGQIPIASRTKVGMGGKPGSPTMNVIDCPSCRETGKPDPEIWGRDGIWANDPYEWDDGREEKNPMEGYE